MAIVLCATKSTYRTEGTSVKPIGADELDPSAMSISRRDFAGWIGNHKTRSCHYTPSDLAYPPSLGYQLLQLKLRLSYATFVCSLLQRQETMPSVLPGQP